MNSGYGVAKQEMHPTKTKHNLVTLERTREFFEIGDDQHMVFQEGSN